MAILVGLKNEKASMLLEDVVHASLLNPDIEVDGELLKAVAQTDYVKYGLKEAKAGYELQGDINDRVGISVASVSDVVMHSRLVLCGAVQKMDDRKDPQGKGDGY